MEGTEDIINKNVTILKNIICKMFETLLSNLQLIPAEVRAFLAGLWESYEKHSNQNGSQLISAIFFLRLICPAIISPTKYFIIKKGLLIFF